VKKAKKKKHGRSILSILLAVILMVGMLPSNMMSVEAEENNSSVTFTAITGCTGASDSENYDKLVDGDNSTKYCVTEFPNKTVYAVIEASQPVKLTGYTLVTGNDNAEYTGRNPKDWTVYGCNDADEYGESENWEVIQSITEDTVLQDKNNTSYNFEVSSETKYRYFKLEFNATKGADVMQLSEFIPMYTLCDTHDFSEEGIEVAPTCTEAGYTGYACSACGTIKKENIVEPLGHSFGAGGVCTNCGSGNKIVIAMTDSYGDGWYNSSIIVKADGEEIVECTVESGKNNTVEIERVPCMSYSFYWNSSYYTLDSECSFTISSGGVNVNNNL